MSIIVKHNAAPKTLFKKIKEIVFDEYFTWCFLQNSAYSTVGKENYFDSNDVLGFSFYHMVLVEGNKYLSPYSPIIEAFVLAMFDNCNIEVSKIDRIRIGCITAKETHLVNKPHVDLYKPHKVALLYFNTCDGDTYLYNEKFDPTKNIDPFKQFLELDNKFTLLEKSTPEENKLLVFDGLHYHSSSSPSNVSRRIVMNINFN